MAHKVIRDEYELNAHTNNRERDDKGAPYFYAFADEDARDNYFIRYPRRLKEEVICILTGTKFGLDFTDLTNSQYLAIGLP